jgi:molecular chaperone HtpG
MAKLLEKFEMKTKFEGLIKLLAESLYSEPDVFIRELIQNAHDGIVRYNRDYTSAPNGRIEVITYPNESKIIFKDNGIGMDKSDIKEFLSVIGSTGTGTVKEELKKQGLTAHDLIGQFGIGMLSAFIVADKVIVKTKKHGEKESFAWHNEGSADCMLYDDDKSDIGTVIEVFVRKDYAFTLKNEYVEKAISKYCDFIEFPIILDNRQINHIDAPWHKNNFVEPDEKEAEYKNFLNRRFNDLILDVIPINIEENHPVTGQLIRVSGALYISDQHTPGFGRGGVVDIFIRRMFIRSNDNELLPSWAKFINGIIESPDLIPTAARDNVIKEKSIYPFIQGRLGDLIVERLQFLAEREKIKFKKINWWHHYHLKGMALTHDDFFEKVGDLLLFKTNFKNERNRDGYMSLKDYLPKNKRRKDKNDDDKEKIPIYYFEYEYSAPQFYALADAQGIIVVNAGLKFEDKFVEKFASQRNDIMLVKLDVTDDEEFFPKLDKDEERKFDNVVHAIEANLRRGGITNLVARVRKFYPAELPSILISTPETEADEKLRVLLTKIELAGFDDIAQDTLSYAKSKPLYLSLNANNPLVQQCSKLTDVSNETMQNILTGIYHSAFIYAHNLLTPENANRIHSHFVSLLELNIQNYRKAGEVQQELEDERSAVAEIQKHFAEKASMRPDHILLFMITPFDDYKNIDFKCVENAVKKVFESAPYYFEVRLSRDYQHELGMIDNIRTHLSKAHGVIADITSSNPNVMLELGAALLKNEGQPIFTLRRKKEDDSVPADIKELIRLEYEGSSQEELVSSISNLFLKDGSIKNEQLNQLVRVRKKLFLSKPLLQSLVSEDISLKDEQIDVLMGKYKSIEEVVNASADLIATQTGIKKFIVEGMKSAFDSILNKLSRKK